MKKSNKSGAKFLCAVIMAFAMIMLSVPVGTVSAADDNGDRNSVYKYAVTIEFGSMTFCYDYGKWDVNEMRYKSGEGSQNPAHDTTEGYPGWYGFDGTANRISVKYSNENENDGPMQNRKLSVTLEYRNNQTDDGGNIITGIEMDFYSDVALTVPFNRNFIVPHTSPEDDNAKTVIYASLKGAPLEYNPTTNSWEKYGSDTFAPVGMLTIRVGEISD